MLTHKQKAKNTDKKSSTRPRQEPGINPATALQRRIVPGNGPGKSIKDDPIYTREVENLADSVNQRLSRDDCSTASGTSPILGPGTADVSPQAVQLNQDPGRSNTTGMSDPVKSRMEDAFNSDFSDVRIFANSPKAPELGALAYTQGSDIHFAPGRYNPTSSQGQHLLGHELAHVVQQRSGLVSPTTKVNNIPVNDETNLEAQADTMGARVSTFHTPIKPPSFPGEVLNVETPKRQFQGQENHRGAAQFKLFLNEENKLIETRKEAKKKLKERNLISPKSSKKKEQILDRINKLINKDRTHAFGTWEELIQSTDTSEHFKEYKEMFKRRLEPGERSPSKGRDKPQSFSEYVEAVTSSPRLHWEDLQPLDVLVKIKESSTAVKYQHKAHPYGGVKYAGHIATVKPDIRGHKIFHAIHRGVISQSRLEYLISEGEKEGEVLYIVYRNPAVNKKLHTLVQKIKNIEKQEHDYSIGECLRTKVQQRSRMKSIRKWSEKQCGKMETQKGDWMCSQAVSYLFNSLDDRELEINTGYEVPTPQNVHAGLNRNKSWVLIGHLKERTIQPPPPPSPFEYPSQSRRFLMFYLLDSPFLFR